MWFNSNKICVIYTIKCVHKCYKSCCKQSIRKKSFKIKSAVEMPSWRKIIEPIHNFDSNYMQQTMADIPEQ